MDNVIYDFRVWLNCICVVSWICFLLAVLKRKYRLWITVVAMVGGFVLSLFLSLLMPYEWYVLRETFGLIALTVCALLLFSDKWPKVLLAVGIMFADTALCESILMFINPALFQLENWADGAFSPAAHMSIYLQYALILAALMLLTARFFNARTSRMSTKEWLLFAMFPLSQVMILTLWQSSYLKVDTFAITMSILQFLASIVCFGTDLALYFVIRGTSQRAELAAQNRLLSEQIDAQKQHYAALTEQYEQVRVMRHDIANHVHTIQILLNAGDTHAAEQYAAETLAQNTFRSSLGECENPIVDAFLFSRVEEAKKQGIRVETEMRLPYALGVASTDLVAIFGNLMDNAVEACMRLPAERRYIRLSAGVRDMLLAIRMENAADATESGAHRERIVGLQRGLGLQILTDIAAQYHGEFRAQAEDGCYVSTMTLQMDGKLL